MIMSALTYVAQPARVVFGTCCLTNLPQEVDALGARKGLVRSTSEQRNMTRKVACLPNDWCAGLSDPVMGLRAVEGVRALGRALPRIMAQSADPGACSDAPYGACLCGTVLGHVGMSPPSQVFPHAGRNLPAARGHARHRAACAGLQRRGGVPGHDADSPGALAKSLPAAVLSGGITEPVAMTASDSVTLSAQGLGRTNFRLT